MRVVLDTNLIVSGLLWRGLPGSVILSMLDGRFSPLVTSGTLAELDDVLRREKFAERFAASGFTSDDFMNRFVQLVIEVEPGIVPSDIVRDEDDLEILACATGGNADVIVTGDRDLLVLEQYAGIRILTPAAFLDLLNTESR
jgi:putative PIN family toxin of toxin-antitoxin system